MAQLTIFEAQGVENPASRRIVARLVADTPGPFSWTATVSVSRAPGQPMELVQCLIHGTVMRKGQVSPKGHNASAEPGSHACSTELHAILSHSRAWEQVS